MLVVAVVVMMFQEVQVVVADPAAEVTVAAQILPEQMEQQIPAVALVVADLIQTPLQQAAQAS
jgi:hypothetical protein